MHMYLNLVNNADTKKWAKLIVISRTAFLESNMVLGLKNLKCSYPLEKESHLDEPILMKQSEMLMRVIVFSAQQCCLPHH